MIDSVLSFITSELNSYFRTRFLVAEDKVILSSFVELDGGFSEKCNDKVIVSLINIEEDAYLRKNISYAPTGTSSERPAQVLNLYVLCAASFNNYNESLKFISGVIAYFQGKPVLTHANSPTLPAGIEKLIPELQKVSHQDMNYIWGMLGTKYLPCVLYKVKVMTINEGEWKDTPPVISTLG